MKHQGEIIEKAIRTRISISEFARRLHVSRRTIYNWFAQENLSLAVLRKTATALEYDFSSEFPDLFLKPASLVGSDNSETPELTFWKDKYVQLLAIHEDLVFSSHHFHT